MASSSQASPNSGAPLAHLIRRRYEPDFQTTEEEIIESVPREEPEGSDWRTGQLTAMEASCAMFAMQVLTGPSGPPYDGRFLVSEHHEEWDGLVVEHDRLCVLAPRDHSKTFFFDFAYPIWQAVRYPRESGFIFSATQDQAVRILADIKQEIESNPSLRWLVPPRKAGEQWSNTSIRLANGHRIYARGFGTKVRGAHPRWIVVDDALNDETAYSELVRKKQIEYFYTAITNMIVPGGQIIVVGTPFHQSDLYGDLEQNPEYTFKRYQALNGPDEVPLWPERYSKENLIKRRGEIGSIRFTREFMCSPIGDDMSLFPLALFKGQQVERFDLKLGMPLEFWQRAGVTAFIGVDFAISSSVQADYTVIWVMGLDNQGNRWLIDIVRERGLPYQQQLSLINEYGRKYEPALVFIESNQMQRIFGDELIRTTDLPVKKFVTTAQNKNALEKGVPSLRVLLENGKIRIPRGDKNSIDKTNIWIDEMRAMTFQDGKVMSVAAHDDTVMGFFICDQAIRQGAFGFSFGEDMDALSGRASAVLQEKQVEEPVEKPIPETSPRVAGTKAKKARPVDNADEEREGASGTLVFDDEWVGRGHSIGDIMRRMGLP